MNKSPGKIVVKFGGSNLKSPHDIEKIVQALRAYNRPIVAVVSAFYGITNQLAQTLEAAATDVEAAEAFDSFLRNLKEGIIRGAMTSPEEIARTQAELGVRLESLRRYFLGVHYLGEISPSARDRILSYGERLSSFLLAAIFRDRGFDAVEVLPEDLGLETIGDFGNASVNYDKSAPTVAAALEGERIFVVPGFYGISVEGKPTLLGRGGSDYSAAAIARCIKAESLDIWKDVDGFLTADPGKVQGPQEIGTLSYREAAELSYFGARILHPRTVEPLRELSIPIRLFNIDRIAEGLVPRTYIGPDSQDMADSEGNPLTHRVKSLTYSHDFGILRLSGSGVGQAPGILSKVTSALASREINIKSVVTSQTAINLFLSEVDLESARKTVASLDLPSVTRLEGLNDLSIIALVGEGLSEDEQIPWRFVRALSESGVGVKVLTLGASESAAYAVLARDQVERGIAAVHKAFFA